MAAIDNVQVVNANFDKTWTALVNYVSATNFEIRSFEKVSGLMALSFGNADVERYVDCGTWQESAIASTVPYVSRTDLKLNGRMNLFVEPDGKERSRVRITTRYELRDDSGNVYNFTSSTPATVAVRNPANGTIPNRTCRATLEAERQILRAIAAISSR